jgi:hypothetical protein
MRLAFRGGERARARDNSPVILGLRKAIGAMRAWCLPAAAVTGDREDRPRADGDVHHAALTVYPRPA